MSNAGYQSSGGQWPNHQPLGPTTFQPVAPPPRPIRPLPPALLLPAILLIVASTLVITSTFVTVTQTTTRLLSANTRFSGSNARVSVTTTTAWSTTSTVPTPHLVQPLAGWALVLVGAIAMVAAVLLLASRGRWAWTKPLAALTSGLLAGVILMSVLSIVEGLSAAYADKGESVDVSAGPAIWLQMPAGLLAVVVAILAMSRGQRPVAASNTPLPNVPMPFPPNPQPATYHVAPPTPYPPQQQIPGSPTSTPPDA